MSTVEYHYVLTIEAPGVGNATRADVISVGPGATRAEVLAYCKAQLVAAVDRPLRPRFETGNIICWSLAPNAL